MPTDPTPPNTVALSQMMRELSAQPGFTDAFLREIQGTGGKRGAALLTPKLIDHLRELILGKDWQGLDRFPGWTMSAITPTIDAITHVVPSGPTSQLLDVGPDSLTTGGMFEDFRTPSTLPGFSADEASTSIDYGVTRGDGPGPLAAQHAASQRLANILNRLSANGVEGVPIANTFLNAESSPSTPEELIDELLHTGHTITVTDSRYFANFGHLHYNGQDVMMPFFVNTRILVPATRRPLLVPVSHAEYEWHIRGPLVNADVSFYFAIDGKAEFRTMDSLDQAWVMKRDAHTYTGADAVEITRLSAAQLRAYMRLHQAHPELPFGGYFTFGVCQDLVAAIELKLTGKATLFPNTAEDRYFTNPADAEINDLIRRLPKDRSDSPSPERVFASRPVGSSDAELATITIPGLGVDLIAVHDAWTDGTLERTRPRWLLIVLAIVAIAGAIFGFLRLRKHR
jgi:hypothetical protein